MRVTKELIEAYFMSLELEYLNPRVEDYTLNGSVIKIRYSHEYVWDEGRSYDNYREVDLLDYITFVFNSFCAEK